MFFERLRLQRTFLIYIAIGATVFCIDIGSFQGLLVLHVHTLLAASIAYALAIGSHFTLNRYLNFRNFERSIAHQFGTYTIVAVSTWLVTLAVIWIGTSVLHAPPLIAKLCAVIINLPIGFLGHRHFTFGPGILAGIRKYKDGRNLN